MESTPLLNCIRTLTQVRRNKTAYAEIQKHANLPTQVTTFSSIKKKIPRPNWKQSLLCIQTFNFPFNSQSKATVINVACNIRASRTKTASSFRVEKVNKEMVKQTTAEDSKNLLQIMTWRSSSLVYHPISSSATSFLPSISWIMIALFLCSLFLSLCSVPKKKMKNHFSEVCAETSKINQNHKRGKLVRIFFHLLALLRLCHYAEHHLDFFYVFKRQLFQPREGCSISNKSLQFVAKQYLTPAISVARCVELCKNLSRRTLSANMRKRKGRRWSDRNPCVCVFAHVWWHGALHVNLFFTVERSLRKISSVWVEIFKPSSTDFRGLTHLA